MNSRTRDRLVMVGIALLMLLYYGLIGYGAFNLSQAFGSIASWDPHAKPVTWVVSPRLVFKTRPVYDMMTEQKVLGRAPNEAPCMQHVRGGPGDKEWRIFKLPGGLHGITLCEPRR